MLGFLVAGAIVAHDRWSATHRIVMRHLHRATFDPEAAPTIANPDQARRVEEIAQSQAGNLTVYSGFLPFAGAGFDLDGWSFVVDLRKGREHLGDRLSPKQLDAQRALRRGEGRAAGARYG